METDQEAVTALGNSRDFVSQDTDSSGLTCERERGHWKSWRERRRAWRAIRS